MCNDNVNIFVRLINCNDYRRVEEVARDAFWNLYIPGAEEYFVVHKLYFHQDNIKELNFVIEVNGIVEGAVFFTKAQLVSQTKIDNVVAMGPVFISPKYHRQGLGRKLITIAIEKVKSMNYAMILTLGYDYHYKPYGFVMQKNMA